MSGARFGHSAHVRRAGAAVARQLIPNAPAPARAEYADDQVAWLRVLG